MKRVIAGYPVVLVGLGIALTVTWISLLAYGAYAVVFE